MGGKGSDACVYFVPACNHLGGCVLYWVGRWVCTMCLQWVCTIMLYGLQSKVIVLAHSVVLHSIFCVINLAMHKQLHTIFCFICVRSSRRCCDV